MRETEKEAAGGISMGGRKVRRAVPRHQGSLYPIGGEGGPRISVVVPTYNEAKNLPHVFAGLPEGLHEVILVDGRSVDDTIEVAQRLRPDIRVVRQNRRGKGNAMACGFAVATGDIIVMLDADGSADPGEIPRFVSALVEGNDFAKGSRFVAGGGSADITRSRAWGNRWLNRIANWLFGVRYTDLCYGYNAFWRHCLPALALSSRDHSTDKKMWGDGFEIETIINTRIAKAGLRITEVPSFEHPRIFGESNLNTWRDGLRVLRALAIERVNGVGTPPPAAVFVGNHVTAALPTPRPALEVAVAPLSSRDGNVA
jgi:glycosyltransferase involved in cell wall biosynthesis